MSWGERWPFSSCATVSAAITADCFCPGGYLATARSIFLSESGFSMAASSVDLPENDVLGPDDRHDIGEHVAPGHLVQRGKVRKTRSPDLHAPGLIRAVGNEVDAEFPLGRLDRGVGFAGRHVEALAEELEVVDQLLHVAFHFDARRGRHLVVVGNHRPGGLAQPVDALPDDAVRLAHLFDAYQISVVAVAVHAYRDVEIDLIVDRVGLFLP